MMKPVLFKTAIFIVLIFINILIYVSYLLIPKANAGQTIFLSPLAQSTPDTLGLTTSKLNSTSIRNKINILLMGFDGRKGDKNPRCDALHLISLDRNDQSILITSIPRSTKVILPDNSENVIANACSLAGHDFVQKQIREITGEKIDHVIKVGFSQTLGIIRSLGLPSVPTLMYLRNRGTSLGDYQRSRNQGEFIKDMIVKYSPQINQIPKPLQYLIFKTIDTDISYDEAYLLLSELNKDYLENIYHFTVTPDYKNFKKTKYEPPATADWEKDGEYLALQNDLENYLKNIISRSNVLIKNGNLKTAFNLIKVPYSQQLWLQLNDKEVRNSLHYDLLEIYVKTNEDKKISSEDLLDFITEMELENDLELKNRGEELLNALH